MALDPERLSSIDQYGDRVKIIPAEVRGFFKRRRQWVHAILLFVFLILPWTKINGQQSLLLDIAARKFSIFGVTFWSHDAPLIFFILATGTLGLAFVTSVWGRVWCGWACPQTVFIESVFRNIERLVQGSYIERRKLHSAELSFQKIFKLSLTWALFFVASSVIAHSFVAYFVGSEKLVQMIQGSPSENWSYFVWISVMTALVLFDFAWFREQFCIIMCPYGRIQSVLLDQKSLAVVYDTRRGEPRKSLAKAGTPAGDCVSCNRCVQVCPTGIDIRKGLQMECIACTACIDACDEIMDKVKKPRGLIRYDSLDGTRISLLKPRSLIYIFLILVAVSGLAFNLSTREKAQIFVMRGLESPFTVLPDEKGQDFVLNHFKLQIQNQNFQDQQFQLVAPPEWPEQGLVLTVAQNPLPVKSGELATWHFFVRFPANLLNSKGTFKSHFIVKTLEATEPFVGDRELILIGPTNGK